MRNRFRKLSRFLQLRGETLEPRLVLDSTTVFNEIMYHPQDNAPGMEWIELHSQMAVDMDLSQWSLNGAVDYTFPEGTIIPGGGFLVIAEDPSTLAEAGVYSDALGPFAGKLGNGGDTLRLSNGSDRLMDQIRFTDSGDWPSGPDGSGVTLAKLSPDLASGPAENWASSVIVGGTPGIANAGQLITFNGKWQYEASGADVGDQWTDPDFNDDSWQTGTGVLFAGRTEISLPKGTELSTGPVTFYFRTEFDFLGSPETTRLSMQHLIDDGAVFYLNGEEVLRYNMPDGPVTSETLASTGLRVLEVSEPIFLVPDALRFGKNVLSVEVHQSSSSSKDLAFAVDLLDLGGGKHAQDSGPPIVFNEVADVRAADFFVELVNRGSEEISLVDFVVAKSSGDELVLGDLVLAPGEFLALSEADLGFAGAAGERLFLYTPDRDAVSDAVALESRPQARYPDADGSWLTPHSATPGGANDVTLHDEIVINEIMYHHAPIFPSELLVEQSTLIPLESAWRYDQSGVLPAANWMAPGYDDSSFTTGESIFFAGPFGGGVDASEQPITTLHSTGFDSSGVPIAEGQIDPHWTITGPLGASDAFVIVADGFPIPPWIANDAQSRWISIQPTNDNNGPPGEYTYQTTFDLADFVLSSVELTLKIAGDDQILDVLINGQSTGLNHAGFGSLSSTRSITSGFVDGANTLAFIVSNGGASDNPTGLRVELAGTALPLPANTELASGMQTSYFRTTFDYDGDPAQTSLELSSLIDDGAIIYLNGVEVLRHNMPDGPVTFATPATENKPGTASFSSPVVIPGEHLVTGTNVLAVEVHQAVGGDDDLAFGMTLTATETLKPQSDFGEDPEEWIELYNRSDVAVDLSDWQLEGAVRFELPPGTTLASGEYLVVSNDSSTLLTRHPSLAGKVLGDFEGRLANSGETIVLRDAANNPADRVPYFDKGRWPAAADGGGSSLELLDATSDNSRAEVWAASDESDASSWQSITYRGIASPPPGSNDPVLWNEFVFGLLDAGEVLIDDISVIEDPDGAAIELIQNGSFDAGMDSYRAQGNHGSHGLNRIIEDPTDPRSRNQVLQLVATGSVEHMFNHVETTFVGNRSIVNGREYEISYRAKWNSGSPQLNTRLYFNRLARTSILDVPDAVGTPGEANSRGQENLGPTYGNLRHGPIVPAADEPVTIFVAADDPNGVDTLTLYYSVNGNAFAGTPMDESTPGQYQATIPAQAAGAVVQFYVEGADLLGAASTFPADGTGSRALYQVDDQSIPATAHHEFRLIMTDADENLIHNNSNSLSNDRIGATVIFNGTEVYYNVGVRMKGSGYSRDSGAAGYNLRFAPDNLFRGVHDAIAIDRNGGPYGPGASHREMVLKHITTHASDLAVMYDDLIYLKSSRSGFSGTAQLMQARYDDVFLDASYKNGSDGTRFKFDLIYWSNVIPGGGVEATKNGPSTVLGVDIRDLGDDKEAYRNHFLIKNGRDRDDYSSIIELGKTLSLSGGDNGSQIDLRSQAVMDVDQWLRNFAFESLGGINDTYNQGLPHNLQLFVRPEDNRVVPLPWDMDFAFHHSTSMALEGTGSNFRKVINIPNNHHYFLGHLEDIIDTTYNTTYLTPWVEHLATFAANNDTAAILDYVQQRETYVTSQFPAATSFGLIRGNVKDVGPARTVTLHGNGWINVREIRLAGRELPLEVVWRTDTQWTATLPVVSGTHDYVLEAYDFQGELINTATVNVTSTAPQPPVDHLRIVELMYHPAGPSTEETAAGFTDDNDFEFIELQNTSDVQIELAGTRFAAGLDFAFAGSDVTSLDSGERVVIVKDRAAFELRYGTDVNIAGEFASGTGLSNGGERIWLLGATGDTIIDFEYDDRGAWPDRADGRGASLEIIDPAGDAGDGNNWRSSTEFGGTPGAEAMGVFADVVVNEVLANSDGDEQDRIELLNTSGGEVDISGWFLSDSNANLKKYQIPAGTTIPAGGFLVFDESHINAGDADNDFLFNGSRGDDVWLMAADADGQLVRFADHADFGSSESNVSFGRVPDGSGDLVPNASMTFGAANSDVKLGDVIISEIMFNPADGVEGEEPTSLEYIELYNRTTADIDLTAWRLRRGIDMDFAPGTTIGAAGTLVVISFNPDKPENADRLAEFLATYGIDESVPIVGGYGGRLENVGEVIEVQRPGEPLEDDPSFTPHIISDHVRYNDAAPWPQSAAGEGDSLHRTAPDAFGNIPQNWLGLAANPGTITFAPPIEGPEVDVVTVASTTATNGPLVDGHEIPGPPDQLSPLSWTNVDQIVLTFSKDVSITQGDLSIGGVNVADYATSDFSYDVGTRTATWTLAEAFGPDDVLIVLSDAVVDSEGNSIDGRFAFRIRVLPGDGNLNGIVDIRDVQTLREAYLTSIGDAGYQAEFDFDGSGLIDLRDLQILRENLLSKLPEQLPSPVFASLPRSEDPDPAVIRRASRHDRVFSTLDDDYLFNMPNLFDDE